MKKLLFIIALASIFMSGCNGNKNESYLESDGLIYKVISNSAYISSYTPAISKNLFIPKKVKSFCVVGIEDNAFNNCTIINNVVFEESGFLKVIGNFAFSNCPSLSSVAVPKSVLSIGCGAFSNCPSLSSIVIPNSITSIEEKTFYGCSSLSSIKIPNNVNKICYKSFEGCSSLTSITLPFIGETKDSNNFIGYIFGAEKYTDNYWYVPKSLTKVTISNGCLTKIPNDSFYECSSISIINIPNDITSIESGAFSCCTSLESINIPNNVSFIGEDAFFGCTALKSVIIPKGVRSINNFVFSYCTSLISVTITDRIDYIGKGAFFGCSSLDSIKIPYGIDYIEKYAFACCSSLESIVIPDSVHYIGENTFFDCDILKIYCEAPSKPQKWDQNWNPDHRPVYWGYKQ